VPFYFGWGDRKLNIIHSRLRNMCSSLIADLHLVNLKPSPACICGHGFEDCIHFFLECPFFNEDRAILFNKLKNCVVTIELILAGDENLTPNQTLKSSLLFILLLEAPSALANILAYSLQSMLFFVVFVCLKTFFFFLSFFLSLCFEHIISPYFFYINFIINV
jgi:hypothetical protein